MSLQKIRIDQIFNKCDIINWQPWSEFPLPMVVYVIAKGKDKYFAFTEDYINRQYEDSNQYPYYARRVKNPYTKELIPRSKSDLEQRIVRPYTLEENQEIIRELNEEREELQQRVQRMALEREQDARAREQEQEQQPNQEALSELSETILDLSQRNYRLNQALSNLRFQDERKLSSTVENFRGILDEVMDVSKGLSQMNQRLIHEKDEFQKQRDSLLDKNKIMRNRVQAAAHLQSQNGLLQLEIDSLKERLKESERNLNKQTKESRRLTIANDKASSKLHEAKEALKVAKKQVKIINEKLEEGCAKISALKIENDNLSNLLKKQEYALNAGLTREMNLEAELKVYSDAQRPLIEREKQIGIEWRIRYEQAEKKHFAKMNAMKVDEIKRVQEYNSKMALLEKERKSLFFPTIYVTTRLAQVRAGESRQSQMLEQLSPGTAVRVIEIRKDRARICSPVKGWVSVETQKGKLLKKRQKPKKNHRRKKKSGNRGCRYENGDDVLVEIDGNSFEAIVTFYDKEAGLYEVKWAHYRGSYDVSSDDMKPIKPIAMMPSADSESNTTAINVQGVIPFPRPTVYRSANTDAAHRSPPPTPSRPYEGNLGSIRPCYA